jgi:hypothetical protein
VNSERPTNLCARLFHFYGATRDKSTSTNPTSAQKNFAAFDLRQKRTKKLFKPRLVIYFDAFMVGDTGLDGLIKCMLILLFIHSLQLNYVFTSIIYMRL